MTQSIHDVLLVIRARFDAAGIETPALDADVLVQHVLEIDRTQLVTIRPDPFPVDRIPGLESLVERRLQGEPISLLIGHREFYGCDLRVTPAVLTPRPETELLVEWALTFLTGKPDARIIDIGTGSGAIAIAIASNNPPPVQLAATDISSAALEIARENAATHVPGRISFVLSDLFEKIDEQFDVILANLPYLTPAQLTERSELAYEPELALVSGPDGLDLIRRLIGHLPDHLAAGGAIALEFDPAQATLVAGLLLQTHVLSPVQVHRDYAGLARFATAIRV